ncbi:MAG: fatty acid desaturase [Bdellovibrionales bacterium]|nr:fatty acid desaturase [Bdellovibrionales bacterium]
MDVPKDFTVVSNPDLHRERARALVAAHPELKNLMGTDPWPAAIIFLLVAAQTAVAIAFEVYDVSGYWILLTAVFVGSVFNHWLAMGVHESSHQLIFKGFAASRWLAIFANMPVIVPGAMTFFRWHMDHHIYLGREKLDNDLPSNAEADIVGNSGFKKAMWLFFYPFFGTLARGFMRKPDSWEWKNIVCEVIYVGTIVYFFGWLPIGYLLLSSYIGMGPHPVAAHWIHEHYTWRQGQETYSYYGPLNWVTFNVGYHFEHHDLIMIPAKNLPKVRKIAPEFYEGKDGHRSWSRTMLRFIFDKRLSHYSRLVRRPQTIDPGT